MLKDLTDRNYLILQLAPEYWRYWLVVLSFDLTSFILKVGWQMYGTELKKEMFCYPSEMRNIIY
jgi:hypothetical protein